MAYNTGFPATYQPLYYQPQQYQQPAQQQSNGITWIQGEAAAKSYLVAPNNSVVLFDSESQTIYIKSADASGMPSMKTLDYTIRENQAASVHQNANQTPALDLSGYVTKAEFESLKAKIDSLTKGGAENG